MMLGQECLHQRESLKKKSDFLAKYCKVCIIEFIQEMIYKNGKPQNLKPATQSIKPTF